MFYDSVTLLQSPVVTSVVPAVWSTTASTNVTIIGERYVRPVLLSPFPFPLSLPGGDSCVASCESV
jgi:hypothetical protein